MYNIKVVDRGVHTVTKLVEGFYGDDKTSFIFTADHGMNDLGSHGDGYPDNTRSPLVAWGSGVARPVTSKTGIAPGHEDGLSTDWVFDHVQRHDIEQADVAALMAYLVGVEYPVNSVGQLPLDYLDANPKEKALAALANTQGVLEMYRVKEEQNNSSVLRYVPFQPLSGDGETSIEGRVANLKARSSLMERTRIPLLCRMSCLLSVSRACAICKHTIGYSCEQSSLMVIWAGLPTP
jgi:phosphatidylinositol glycan class N